MKSKTEKYIPKTLRPWKIKRYVRIAWAIIVSLAIFYIFTVLK